MNSCEPIAINLQLIVGYYQRWLIVCAVSYRSYCSLCHVNLYVLLLLLLLLLLVILSDMLERRRRTSTATAVDRFGWKTCSVTARRPTSASVLTTAGVCTSANTMMTSLFSVLQVSLGLQHTCSFVDRCLAA